MLSTVMRLNLGANFCDKHRSEMFNEFYNNFEFFYLLKVKFCII